VIIAVAHVTDHVFSYIPMCSRSKKGTISVNHFVSTLGLLGIRRNSINCSILSNTVVRFPSTRTFFLRGTIMEQSHVASVQEQRLLGGTIRPFEDISWNQDDEMPFTRKTVLDAYRATGYLADSEGRISAGRRIAVPRERHTTTGSRSTMKTEHILAGSKKKKNKQGPSPFTNLGTHSRYHRRRSSSRGGKKPYPCRRWIQRVYSHTSHKHSNISDINGLEDLSSIMINRSNISIGQDDMARLPMLQACPVLDFRVSGLAASIVRRSAMMPGLQDDEPTEPQDEYSTLMRILSALKEDYHMIQAQYQSYAPH